MSVVSQVITLEHWSGWLLSNELISDVIVRQLAGRYCGKWWDSTWIDVNSGRIAMTTDSFVVDPIFFQWGDIGKMAVCGTVNDLAVSGARPKFLSFWLILEEGFPIGTLEKIISSMRITAEEADIYFTTGDTKVLGKWLVDKIVINTCWIGIADTISHEISMDDIFSGNDIIISSYIGDHAIQILSQQEGLGFENIISSDCAPLNNSIFRILEKFPKGVRFMRDITRWGLGSVLNEISKDSGFGIEILIDEIPVRREVRMATDLLGISPLHLANEWCFLIIADKQISNDLVSFMKWVKYCTNAKLIWKIVKNTIIGVVGISGGHRECIDSLLGKNLPRLC